MAAGLGALRAALEARGLRVESLEVAHDPHEPDQPHERTERPAAETPRQGAGQEAQPRQGGPHDSRGGDRGNDGGEGRSGSPEREAGRGESTGALEDSAHIHMAGEASETLVSLRLDTVA